MTLEKGKKLEKIIELVQRSLKNSSGTQVFTNFKIKNRRGKTREIDVLVVSTVNDFEIKIAIECKNYKRKVGAEKIEAFHSKCLLIPNINKKIFVSGSGYQSGAIESAEDFDIELLNAHDVTSAKIQELIDTKMYGISFRKNFGDTTLEFFADVKINQQDIISNFDGKIYISENEYFTLADLLSKILLENFHQIRQMAIEQWSNLDNENKYVEFPVIFGAELNNHWTYYLGNKVGITKVVSCVFATFVEHKGKIIENKSVMDLQGDLKANAVTVDIDKNLSANIITDKKLQKSFYLTDKDGNSTKLELLHEFKNKEDTQG